MVKPGSIVHVEIHSADPAKSKQFFGEVFRWKFMDIPEMNYSTFEAPTPPHGGLMAPMENMPPQVLNYILCEDIEETVRKIEAAGGAILTPKTEITGIGWFAVFREPGGTSQALLQALPRPRAARPRAKPRKAAKKAGRRRRK